MRSRKDCTAARVNLHCGEIACSLVHQSLWRPAIPENNARRCDESLGTCADMASARQSIPVRSDRLLVSAHRRSCSQMHADVGWPPSDAWTSCCPATVRIPERQDTTAPSSAVAPHTAVSTASANELLDGVRSAAGARVTRILAFDSISYSCHLSIERSWRRLDAGSCSRCGRGASRGGWNGRLRCPCIVSWKP